MGTQDHPSPAFREPLNELKRLCSASKVLPKSFTLPELLVGCVYEGTFNGSRVRIRRVRPHPRGDSQKVEEVRAWCCIHVLGDSRILQAFHQVAVTSKHLSHQNIVRILGVNVEPFELISDWMPGGDLPGYVAEHPDVDRRSLVGYLYTASGTC